MKHTREHVNNTLRELGKVYKGDSNVMKTLRPALQLAAASC